MGALMYVFPAHAVHCKLYSTASAAAAGEEPSQSNENKETSAGGYRAINN